MLYVKSHVRPPSFISQKKKKKKPIKTSKITEKDESLNYTNVRMVLIVIAQVFQVYIHSSGAIYGFNDAVCFCHSDSDIKSLL